jgi:hypothetical protein
VTVIAAIAGAINTVVVPVIAVVVEIPDAIV